MDLPIFVIAEWATLPGGYSFSPSWFLTKHSYAFLRNSCTEEF